MNAQTLPVVASAESAPEWIQLLPAGTGGVIETSDERGPYHVNDAQQIISASFANDTRLPIDENHATDLAAPRGDPAPARGWIVAMEARPDGIWGQVEWTTHGADLVSSKAYRGISPVIMHTKAKQIHSILRASLVNDPNFRGMASLHQKENDMDLRGQLIEMLSLTAEASDAEIMKALKAKKSGGDEPALQSAMGEIGVALGLATDAKLADIVVAVQAAKTAALPDESKDGLITELQASVTALAASLKDVTTGLSATASQAFYEKALQEKRAGVGPASKDHWVALHQSDPEKAEAMIAAMPQLDHAGVSVVPPATADGVVSLNAAQKQVADQLGMSHEDYSKELNSETKGEVA